MKKLFLLVRITNQYESRRDGYPSANEYSGCYSKIRSAFVIRTAWLLLLTYALFSLLTFSFAQQSKIDSLLYLLKKDKPDTNKVIHLKALGWELMYSNPDTAILLGNQALALCEKLRESEKVRQGESENISPAHSPAFSLSRLLASTLGQLGAYNALKGDYPKALDYYLKALKIDEELFNSSPLGGEVGRGAKEGIAKRLVNIGNVYLDQADYPKALDYYFKALKMNEELGRKSGIATALGSIGIVYRNQGDYPKALDYYFKALKMAEELGNKNIIATALGNIGIVYKKQGDYPKALDYYFRALKTFEELGNKNYIAAVLGNIGLLYTKAPSLPPPSVEEKKGFALAEKYLLQAIEIDSAIGAQSDLRQLEENLSHLYDTMGSGQWSVVSGQLQNTNNKQLSTNYYQLSLIHYKKAMVLKDTLFSEENKKQLIRKEMNYEFEKKEAAVKAEQEKKDAVAKAESKRQKMVIWLVMAVLLLVVVFAGFIFRGYKQKQKANIIITKQKEEVEKKNEIIERQKKIVEEHNKDITDSINYAQRIQDAILPPLELAQQLFPEAFVLFLPKDIVSGDFYWFSEKNGRKLIAAVDCTGHGVPGAFMSMLGNAFLNEIVEEREITTPSEVLSELRFYIIRSLKQTDTKGAKDGMDISLLNFYDSHAEWAGANNPLWLIRSGELIEYKPDKRSIGYYKGEGLPFANHKIALQKGDLLYIFSDGYADQFSSADKKLMIRRFKDILLSIQDKTMNEQKEFLDSYIKNWRGHTEQTDDILVIGVKIS